MATNEEILRAMGAVPIELMGERMWQINPGHGYSADKQFIESAMQRAREDSEKRKVADSPEFELLAKAVFADREKEYEKRIAELEDDVEDAKADGYELGVSDTQDRIAELEGLLEYELCDCCEVDIAGVHHEDCLYRKKVLNEAKD